MILVLDIENVPQGWGQWEIDDGHCTTRAGTLMRRYVNCTTSKQYNEGTDFGLHLQMWTQHPNWYMLFFVTLGDCCQRQIWHPQWDWKLTLLFFNRRAILELICMLTMIDTWLRIVISSPNDLERSGRERTWDLVDMISSIACRGLTVSLAAKAWEEDV